MPKDATDLETCGDVLSRSPSGLFTRRSWERELEAAQERMPDWYWQSAECERHFALWVHARAKSLAAELDSLVQPDIAAGLARKIESVADTLWADAEWARRRADGRDAG